MTTDVTSSVLGTGPTTPEGGGSMTQALSLLGARAEIARQGLILPPDLAFDEWQEIGERLRMVEGAVQWCVGDWMNYGERRYGEKYAQAIESTEWSYQTIANAAWVASRVQFSRRRENLTWSHHETVAALEPHEQDALLDAAEENDWTRGRLRAAARRHKQQLKQPDFPTDKYRVIYADPPWQYSDTRSGLKSYGPAERHYPTMSTEALCELPVEDLATDNAVLFLWTTSPFLEDAFALVSAWGFEYKTSFVWDKVRHNFGHYNSVRHELLLVCTRGSCTPDNAKLHDSVVVEERTSKHSHKPDCFRELIDGLYTHGPRIELFARAKVDGWERWGNEV